MNICFMLGGFYKNGGIGRVTSIIANFLSEEENINVYTLSYVKYDKSYLYHIDQRIIDDHFLNKPQNMGVSILRGGIKKLKRYLRKNNIDVLVACGALFFPICTLACKNEKCKCICWEHSNGNNSDDHHFQMLCRRVGCKYSDAILNITVQDQEIYREKFGKQTYFQIYNPLDDIQEKETSMYNDQSARIITVGRLCYQKNYPALIKVAKEVLNTFTWWEWDIYGEGKDREEIEELIQREGLSQKLHLKGQVPDLYDRYAQYSFLVMTSRYEGFGMALIEASSRKLPVVAFDVECGPREIIQDKKNGFLIPAFDCSLMADRIKELCESQELRRQMSYASTELAQRFEKSNIKNQWINMLNDVNKL